MADGSEDSYLYMKNRSKPLHELDNGQTASGKLPSSRIPKKVCADTQRLPTPNVRPQDLKAVVGHSSSFDVPQSVEPSTTEPTNYNDCMAFDLYEQDPDMDFECEDYNLRRQSSDFRLSFEDMIVLPIRLKIPSTSVQFDTPPSADIDEFDYADQHAYFSRLTTAVNSDSAIHEYGTRKGPLWNCAWEMLVPKGLHPAYLTEIEFVELVLSQGNDTAKWMDVHIPTLHRRALQKAASARQKLTNAGISPFELTQEYLESFEWMDKIEQDNFVKTMQKLQLQVAFQKEGLSMRIEDIDNTTFVDEEKLIGKSHTKLVDGCCIPRDHSSEVDESFMVDQMSLSEFEDQFWANDFKASAPSSTVPIQQTHQSPTTLDICDEAISMECIKTIICPCSSRSSSSGKHPEHIEPREVRENSDDTHQDTKNISTIENGSLKLSQFTPLEASSPNFHTASNVLPLTNHDSHVIFSVQDPPTLSPTRPAPGGYTSDGSESLASATLKDNKTDGNRRHITKSSGSQKCGKPNMGTSETPGTNGKFGSIGKKLSDSPSSLKKKLSSVFGTIGRSGKRSA
ncbi:hypothetical protein SBOR_1070 [Sclerotinia borealis F-4128]|uniref:Uncharacterized protein n=1 Tax=Sclerotinia borealis (strain F-4128) TaxID=1432307 RepID=W9CR29_SCLBF|nr:hypothetical protein SBOR_1070 [Sclerotinia borealis F-4128]